jgi:hypothetical protein
MFKALNWYETLCRIQGITEVTEADVVGHLTQGEGRVDLAKDFVSDYLLPAASE